MTIQKTPFEGLFEITPEIFHDNRGYFMESFRSETLSELGINTQFVQDNQSFSKRNVIRGLHLQVTPHEQIKLVRAVSGKVLDVVVDLRKESPTFGEHFKCILDGERGNMLYVPAGFAHGISVLEDAIFAYKCSAYYNKESEEGIIFNDPDLNIDWEVNEPILSKKDMLFITFKEFVKKYDLA
ncbi:MAG: dTDP-4-dehydrorhamnose 3,5-epimerase [Saprospiraceae bacterium]|nr:dTDP-4-dehydrorhamnose 3,5-epimerase [Saprospiraceae bacterium]